MLYAIPSDNGEDCKLVPVFGKYVGFYQLFELDSNTNQNSNITLEELFSGNTKINSGSVVEISNKKYTISQRRVIEFNSWMFKPGAILFFGLQHDHIYIFDYQFAAWYKDHEFNNIKSWLMNQNFKPVFCLFTDQNRLTAKDCDIVLFEQPDQIRNPNLDYSIISNHSTIDEIFHDLVYCAETAPTKLAFSDDLSYVYINFSLNKFYPNQLVYIKPLINVPISHQVMLSDQGIGQVIYRLSDLIGKTISFEVYPNNISAGKITVDIDYKTRSALSYVIE